jgi:tetratricopeptide (TPR) repeat protein
MVAPATLKLAKADIKRYSQDHEPIRWADGHMTLSQHYLLDILRSSGPTRAADKAIEHIEEALKVIPEDNHQRFVACQAALARMHPKRVAGNRTENLARAYAAAKTALRVCKNTDWSCPIDVVAELHKLIGAIYADGDFVSINSRAANEDLAIRHYLASLQRSSMHDANGDWVTTQLAVGWIYARRTNGKRHSNLKVAIKHLSEALKVYTKSTQRDKWAKTQEQLAMLNGQLIQIGRSAETSEEAYAEEISELAEKWIVSCKNALQVFTPTYGPKSW